MTRLREHLKQTLADIDEIFGTAPNVSQTPFDWDTTKAQLQLSKIQYYMQQGGPQSIQAIFPYLSPPTSTEILPYELRSRRGLTSMEPKLVADPQQQQLTWPDGAVGGLDPDPKA